MTANASKNNCEDQARKACCKNPFLSIKFFVCCHGLLQLSQLLVSGYLKSSISTIEKRFGLSSQMSGLVASFNEIGNVALIVFVSYFGSRVHRPRVIGCGALLVCIAGFIMSLPHFMEGPYQYDQSIASVHSNLTDICQLNGNMNINNSSCTIQSVKRNTHVLSFLFIGQFLLGIGGVPIQPFGISYIDDFASKRNSPLYIGILYAVTFMGPGVAFMLGSAMLRYYVDIDKIPADKIYLTPKDPRWVGAWWLGFLVAASVVGISALPYFFFPRSMQKEASTEKDTDNQPRKDLMNECIPNPEKFQHLSVIDFIKLFPRVLLKNLRNPVCLLVILAQVNLSAMVAGIAIFMAKFLERQFSITASMANLILGAINIPGAMVGIILGGVIMKRFQMTLKQCGAMCAIAMSLCIAIAMPLLFLGCSTTTFFAPGHIPAGRKETGLNISICNSKCNCPDTAFNPICGSDGIEYISPCYAGCEAVNFDIIENKVMNYTQCSCIPSLGGDGLAKPGSCGSNCFHLLFPFIVLSCLAGMVASTSHTPSFIIILRSVQQAEKSLAIGIQFMLLRVLAWMPCPVLYGLVIDSTCLLWERKCENKASCRYYDNSLFRHRYLGLQIVFEVGAFVCFLLLFIVLRKQEREAANKSNSENQTLTVKSQKGQDTRA